jgi:hypothetical protein
MSRRLIALPLVAVAALASPDAVAQGWRATSTAGISITGDIRVERDAIILANSRRLRLRFVTKRKGLWSPVGDAAPGAIYRLSKPSDPHLLNGNTLCGIKVTYIVLSQLSESSLAMIAFTGRLPPKQFGDHSCAAFFYER